MEKLFSFFWKNKSERLKKSQGYVFTETYGAELKMWAQLVLSNQESIDIGYSLWGCGYIDQQLLLPKELAWTTDLNLNIKLLKLLILKASAIKELKFNLKFDDRQRIFPRIEILKKMHFINLFLDQKFPFYKEFESEIISELFKYIKDETSSEVYNFWKERIVSRSLGVNVSFKKVFNRRNDEPPDFLMATVPLPLRQYDSMVITNPSFQKTENSNTDNLKKRQQSEYVQKVNQEEKKETNPVMHSFEKMETADDYDGGRRIEDGEDQLSDHQNALDELELNRSTTDGKTSSVYKQDSVLPSGLLPHQIDTQSRHDFYYPEWDYKNSNYRNNYCRVIQAIHMPANEDLLSPLFIEKNSPVLNYWKLKMAQNFNTPLWENKLIDGSEIDLDNYIRIASEKNYSSTPRIYAQKNCRRYDYELHFLVDISYSTDTWIDGVRVFDIIQEILLSLAYILPPELSDTTVSAAYSETRNAIYYLNLKNQTSSWQDLKLKLNSLRPQQYTRFGPAIRHTVSEVRSNKKRKPLMILITDGKPTDLDPYEGKHGQMDVKKAIQESKKLGLDVMVVTISDQSPEHLKTTFVNYSSVKNLNDFWTYFFKFLMN